MAGRAGADGEGAPAAPPATAPAPPAAAPAPPAASPAPPAGTPPVWGSPTDAPPAAGAPTSTAQVGLATRSGSWFAGLDPRGWRTTIVAAVLMFGVVFGVNLVNAAVPLPADPGQLDPGSGVPGMPTPGPGQPTTPPVEPGPVEPGAGVDVGSGVVAYPPAGWSVVGAEPGQAILQKGGAVLVIGALPWTDTPLALATAYRDAFFAAGELTANEPETGEIGNGIPAVGFGYTGILDGTPVDGAMFAGATGTTGVVVNVFAASGTLRALGDDIDEILATIQVAGDPQ
jgi:hypothetical protein